MRTLDWYFDFVSPFAYLQSRALERLGDRVIVRRRPILFAGLLSHWGHLGPAEIPPKREWTFRRCVWLAARHDVPLTMPAMHPFNSLPLLRLSTALGDTPDAVDRLFRFVWVEGKVPTDVDAWANLMSEMNVVPEDIASAPVKDALRRNGEEALAAGVFGVPTAVVDEQAFWGFEATDMLLEYLDGAEIFGGSAMDAAVRMPMGPMRPQVAAHGSTSP